MELLRSEATIVGGGVGGVAAALALARLGRRVLLIEETDWLGGQLTTQAVPPDEHGWIERFGCTASYRRFRENVRQYYREHHPLKPAHRANPRLNPGNGWVSPLCHEPRVALAVLEAMLAPYIFAGNIHVLYRHRVVAARMACREQIASLVVRDQRTGRDIVLASDYFLDATETGEVLPLAEVEHVTGAESHCNTGEPSAPQVAAPANAQAFSVCFILEHREGEPAVISEPETYAYWRRYVPSLRPPWPGPLLGWRGLDPRTLEPIDYTFNPHREPSVAFAGLWTYRRILDRTQFEEGSFCSDLCLVNWPMIDYIEGDLLTCAEPERERHIDAACQLSLSMVYWLQTEAPRPDGGIGWPGLRLRGDLLGTADGLAKSPYIRESRRIRALYTVSEPDVSAACRRHDRLAERFEDSVGIGAYRIDLHPSTGGDNYIDVASLPFRIPLGALIPVSVENLLPAAKNIGTTHIVNGCYRVHPVEWNVGEAAGALVAFCLQQRCRPREVHLRKENLAKFQAVLRNLGVELSWPEDLDPDEGDPHRHAQE